MAESSPIQTQEVYPGKMWGWPPGIVDLDGHFVDERGFEMKTENWMLKVFADDPETPIETQYFYNQRDAEAKADKFLDNNPSATCTVKRIVVSE